MFFGLVLIAQNIFLYLCLCSQIGLFNTTFYARHDFFVTIEQSICLTLPINKPLFRVERAMAYAFR